MHSEGMQLEISRSWLRRLKMAKFFNTKIQFHLAFIFYVSIMILSCSSSDPDGFPIAGQAFVANVSSDGNYAITVVRKELFYGTLNINQKN